MGEDMFCSSCGTQNLDDASFCSKCGKSLVAELQTMKNNPQYIGFWYRVLAYIIDGFLINIAAGIIGLFVGFVFGFLMALNGMSEADIEAVAGLLGGVIGLLVGWLWFAISESSSWQASLGKKILGFKVVDANGQRLTFGRATGRYFVKILSGILLCIGFIMVAFTQKKQGLHDKIANTYVVKNTG